MDTKPTYEELEQRIEELESSEAEYKQNEKVLRESEKKYRTLVENIDVGVTIIDPDLNIIFANNTVGKWFDKSSEEFIGKKCYQEFEKKSQPCSNCPGLKVLETGQPCEIESEGVREDGSRFTVRDKAFPIYGEHGKIIGFNEIVEDITERKKAEEERENLLTKLQNAISEIKTLRGILPICSFCKKIRDDKGYWNQVEVYVREHTEVDFTHSLCPECVKVHYSEFVDTEGNNKK